MIITAKAAKEKLNNIPDDAIIFLDVLDLETFIHEYQKSINIQDSERLIDKAKDIRYEDNEIFGTLSMKGILNRTVHNLIFPQPEQKPNECSRK